MNGQRVKIMSNKVKVGSKIKLFYDGKLGRMTIGELEVVKLTMTEV